MASRGESNIDWHRITASLPFARTPDAKQKRDQLFNQFDANHNGYLTFDEVNKGIRDVLQFEKGFDFGPAIHQAFNASKDLVKTKSKISDSVVERAEFRLFLMYMREYFELYVMFQRMDTSQDQRISEPGRSPSLLPINDISVSAPNKPSLTFPALNFTTLTLLLFFLAASLP
jgi:hypothetical protein